MIMAMDMMSIMAWTRMNECWAIIPFAVFLAETQGFRFALVESILRNHSIIDMYHSGRCLGLKSTWPRNRRVSLLLI